MTRVNWHPYPEEKPTKKDRYLINLDDGNGYQYITIATFYKDTFWESGVIDHIVIAWAELPEPYIPPQPEDNHPDAITARKYMSGDPETVKALSIFDE